MKIVPERDIIWLAGVVDGEGSIFVKKQTSGKNDIHSLDVEISMTDQPTIERIYNIVEMGSFRPVKRKKKKAHHKQAWRIVWTSRDAEKVLTLILPYLVTKRDEALVALQFCQLKKHHCGRAGLSEEMIQSREGLYLELKELKRKEYPIVEEIQ